MPQLLPVRFVLRFYARVFVFAALFTLGIAAFQPVAFFPEIPAGVLHLHPSRPPPSDVQELLIPFGEGLTMQVWKLAPSVFPSESSAASPRSALFFRGNGGPFDWHLPIPRWLRDHGFTVYLVNYPGYEKSTGLPGEKLLHAQSEALYQFATRDSIAPTLIAAHSIGSAMASPLAAKHSPHCLLLFAPLSTARDAVADQPYLGWYYRLISSLLLYRFDNVEAVEKLHLTRLLIASGRNDTVLPSREAQKLLDAYGGEWKRGVFSDRAGHNDIFSATKDEIAPLLEQCLSEAYEHEQ